MSLNKITSNAQGAVASAKTIATDLVAKSFIASGSSFSYKAVELVVTNVGDYDGKALISLGGYGPQVLEALADASETIEYSKLKHHQLMLSIPSEDSPEKRAEVLSLKKGDRIIVNIKSASHKDAQGNIVPLSGEKKEIFSRYQSLLQGLGEQVPTNWTYCNCYFERSVTSDPMAGRDLLARLRAMKSSEPQAEVQAEDTPF